VDVPAVPPPAAGRFTQITHEPGTEILASVAPDGKSVVYERNAGGDADIFLQRVGGENSINLTEHSPTDDGAPAFSPDGESIAFRSERDGGGIFVMGATGESVRRLTEFGFNPTWSPDGKQVAFAGEGTTTNPLSRGSVSALWIVDVASGQTRRIFDGDAVQPAWSPSGARIAYWCAGRSGGQRDLATVPAVGGEPTYVTEDVATDWSPAWSPDGRHLYFSSDRGGEFNLWRVSIDEASGLAVAAPEPVTSSVGAGSFHAALSADGERLTFVSATRRDNVKRLALDPRTGDVDRASLETVVGGSLASSAPGISPDGEWLAFTIGGEQEDIVVQRIDGTQRRRLTSDTAKDRFPRWFPGGERIFFYSDRSGSYQVWTIRPDGSDLRPLVGQPENDNLLAEISRDGRRISISAFRDDLPTRVLELDDEGQVAEVETLPLQSEGVSLMITSFSPSGRRVAGELRTPSYEVRGIGIFDFETRTHRKVTDRGLSPQWLDERRLIYFENDVLYHVDAERAATPRAVYTLPSGEFSGRFELSADRRYLYFAYIEREADVWMLALPGADPADGQP
jgi:Tol biopolymer transport system component